MLGFRYDCGKQLSIPEGYLPRATKHLFHNKQNDCSDDPETNRYHLFATRNPLKRMESWFAYEYISADHKHRRHYEAKKPLFVECPFGSLTQLAEWGLGGADHVSSTCRKRAWDAIRGKVAYCRHNYFNYRYFLDRTPADSQLMVLRTEHLVDDWNSVEAQLHAAVHSNDSDVGLPHTITAEDVPKRNKTRKKREELTPRATRLLCYALCHEIQVYKEILQRAQNLTPEQVNESLEELAQTCPREVQSADACQKHHDRHSNGHLKNHRPPPDAVENAGRALERM